MKKYTCFTNGEFEYCTGFKTKSEKKAEKKAIKELTGKAYESEIGLHMQKIALIEIPNDNKEIAELLEKEGVPDVRTLINIKGEFSYTLDVKAKSPEKARDKFMKKTCEEFSRQGIAFSSDSVKVMYND